MVLDWPLMENNITTADLDHLVEFLQSSPILTQSSNVRAFEQEWSEWLGVRHSVYVNSGASANFVTMGAIRHLYGAGEVIVSPLGWVSDVASVIHWGFTPVFCDINPRTLSMAPGEIIARLNGNTRAVLLVHVQGFNGLDDDLLAALQERGIPLIEDVSESHGATHKGQKLGSFGLASNFSFYYGHHLSTVEGGMVCTNDDELYQVCRMFRSHGMVREASSAALRDRVARDNPSLSPDFIFVYPAFNMRGTELGAVIGRNQLPRLDRGIERRNESFKLFLDGLDPRLYRTDFELEGCSNYAFNLVLQEPDEELRDRVEELLRAERVEYRRGSSGGGNQLRQPYMRGIVDEGAWLDLPETEHVHFFGFYIGNYPDLAREKIVRLTQLLNALEPGSASRAKAT